MEVQVFSAACFNYLYCKDLEILQLTEKTEAVVLIPKSHTKSHIFFSAIRGFKIRSPFSLYMKKLKSGAIWYARFYNPTTNEYSVSRSTCFPCVGQQGNKCRANRVASEMVEDIIPLIVRRYKGTVPDYYDVCEFY